MGYLYGVCNKMWTRNADSGPLQISEGQEVKKNLKTMFAILKKCRCLWLFY